MSGIRSTNVDSMLGQRLRRWPKIESTLGECLVFINKKNCGASSSKRLVLLVSLI